jgi:hypothetical protein
LKKLNISNNQGLSASGIGQILAQLKTKGTSASGSGGIQELELGKLQIQNNEKTMLELN